MIRERIHPATYVELQSQIATIEQNQLLADETNFVAREEARTILERRVIDRTELLMQGADKGEKKRLRALKRQALRTKSSLGQVNEQLFLTVREKIKSGDYTKPGLKHTFRGYIELCDREEWSDPPRYDHLDAFIDGILQISALPRAQRQPEPEMVYYQPTPARIVLDMLERLSLSTNDVLYDLGSGLGRVVSIVALVSDTFVKGIEFEPAYYVYAQRRASELALPRVAFVNADAREVNYADGTVFFLYTPFKGKILQRVLELLRYESHKRRIRVCTYGPGTLDMMQQDWLVSVDDPEPTVNRVAIFENR